MWFNKKVRKPVMKDVYELIVNKSIPIKDQPPYTIQCGISWQEDQPEQCRAYFILPSYSAGDLKVYPRQHPMTRERAIKVAYAFSTALQKTYDMGLEQMVTEL